MSFSFETVDVKQELIHALRFGLQDFGYQGNRSIKVIKADPQSHTEFPCIGINRVDDNESNQSLSEGLGHTYNPETKEYGTFYGTFFSESVEVRIWHTNADERESLYHKVRAILFAERSSLGSKGLLNISLRSGRDEQDNTMAHAPFVIYWTSITMTYLNPLDVQFIETVEPITAVYSNARLETLAEDIFKAIIANANMGGEATEESFRKVLPLMSGVTSFTIGASKLDASADAARLSVPNERLTETIQVTFNYANGTSKTVPIIG